MAVSPIIGIAGGSASGKTTLAWELAQQSVSPVLLLPLDRYYRDLSNLPPGERAATNFDHPDALEIDLFCEHIDQLSNWKAVEVPTYDFKTHTRVGSETIFPQEIIIVEGILLLWSDNIYQRLGLSLFMDAPDDLRLQRKIDRDVNERGRTKDFAVWQHEQFVRPVYGKFVLPSIHRADLVLDGCNPMDELIQVAQTRINTYLLTHFPNLAV